MGVRLIEVSDGDLERLSQRLLDLNKAEEEVSSLWDWVEYACVVLGISVPDDEEE